MSESESAGPPPHLHPGRVRTRIVAVVCALAAIALVLAAWGLPPFAGPVQTTDNAYVHGHTTVIAGQVSGYVTQVLVQDFETVTPGQVLVRIDDRVYRAKVEQAQANLAAAVAALANSDQAHAARTAEWHGQQASAAGAAAQLVKARADMGRADDLQRDGSISVRERDQTLAALAQSDAQVRQAQAAIEIGHQNIRTVEVGRAALAAQVDAARAQLHAAEIDLEHTVIRAPEAGRLGEIGVRVGAFVTSGTQMMALVPPERWVIADLKEAQTGQIRPGQPVTVAVDALGGARFRGHVERLAPATGAEFAVLKPDNATGNFVKIPQRIGVRIAIDPGQQGADRLGPGMSVEVRIDTRPTA